jgi:hypothetical protein
MTTRRTGTAALWVLAGAVLLIGLSTRADSQTGRSGRSDRLDRQLGIFEKVLDDMLVESPNFLVQDRNEAQGMYIDGEGAMFTFRVALNSRNWDHHWNWIGDGVRIIFDDDKDRDDRRSRDERNYKDRELDEQEQLYADGKQEIVETLRDFGAVLSALDDNDRIELRIRLRSAAYFKEHDLRKLTVSVSMADVRAFAAGDMGEDRFADRVHFEES